MLDDVGSRHVGQGQDREVNQLQGQLGLHPLAPMVCGQDVVGHRLPGAVVLPGLHVLVRFDGQLELFLLGRNRQGSVADLEGAQRLCLIHALDDDHRNVDVGRVLRQDGNLDQVAVGLQGQEFMLHDVPALDGQQGFDRAGVGRRDQDLGRVAHVVGLFVRHQVNAVVVLPPPVDELVAADPQVSGTAHLVPLFVFSGGSDLVDTALLRCESGHRFAFLVGGHGGGQHRGVLDGALPVETTVFALLPHAVPLVLVEDHRQVFLRHRLAVPIHGDDVHLLLFIHLAHVGLGGQTDVEETLVHDGVGAAGHLLVVDVGHGSLDGVDLAEDLVGNVGRHLEGETPLGVGGALTFGDELAGGAIVAILGPIVVGEIVAATARPAEEIVIGQHRPADVGIRHRTAKVVGGLDIDRYLVALDVLIAVGLHRHLELGLAVLGHLEAGAKPLLAQLS